MRSLKNTKKKTEKPWPKRANPHSSLQDRKWIVEWFWEIREAAWRVYVSAEEAIYGMKISEELLLTEARLTIRCAADSHSFHCAQHGQSFASLCSTQASKNHSFLKLWVEGKTTHFLQLKFSLARLARRFFPSQRFSLARWQLFSTLWRIYKCGYSYSFWYGL